MEYRSFSDLDTLIRNNLHTIPRDIDLVVGVPRSGLLVANLISLHLNKPLTDFDGLLEKRMIGTGNSKNNKYTDFSKIKKILIVEDSVNTGDSIQRCRQKILSSDVNYEFYYLAVYVTPGKEETVDLFFESVSLPRIFEWNVFHHAIIYDACIDIDGVLCVDPTPEQNDDGEKYLDFIKNANSRFIPTRKVKYIVSSRLEKYRKETEEWLKNNNIMYEKLFLLDSTAQERKNNGLHATFKSSIYSKCDAKLFIESDEKQAMEINRITHKPVYCVDSNSFYNGNVSYVLRYEVKNHVRKKISKIKWVKKIYKTIMKK